MRKGILDDRAAIDDIDRGKMLEILEETPEAYEQAYGAALDSDTLPQPLSEPPPYVVLLGMGGSAIAADILKDWLFEAQTPIEVIRGSKLPGSATSGACVLVASYSGQTAEALRALKEARRRNLQVSCVASGGEMLKLCLEEGIPHVRVRAGLQPRAALPHLLSASLAILGRWAVCDCGIVHAELKAVAEQLMETRKKVGFERPLAKNTAKQLALKIHGTIPFIYTSRLLEAAARRFKNQLNENSKVLAKFDVLPEMLHNEVQSWQMLGEDNIADLISFVLLRGCEDEEETRQFRRLRRLIRQRGGKRLHEVSLESPSTLATILATIYYCDCVSFYLAIARGINPTPVRTIQSLKRVTRQMVG